MSRPGGLAATFLTDGGQSADVPAGEIVAFIEEAKASLDVAIYDIDVHGEASGRIAEALLAASARGVRVRAAHNVEGSSAPAAPRPAKANPEAVASLELPLRAVSDDGGLMHHKYIVRDGHSLLTGSTNWTDDSFSREENVIVTVEGSLGLAAAFTANFERLFKRGHVRGSGGEGQQVTLAHNVKVRPYFAPDPLGIVVASLISRASRRLRIVSPVITSGPVLGTLVEFATRDRFDLSGAYDHTQMEEVQRSWAEVEHNRWKIEVWKVIAQRLSGKRSTPWSPSAEHDYMHAKFAVSDDEVLVGSYNLSRNGEDNAENILHVVSEYHASAFAAFADQIADRYARAAG